MPDAGRGVSGSRPGPSATGRYLRGRPPWARARAGKTSAIENAIGSPTFGEGQGVDRGTSRSIDGARGNRGLPGCGDHRPLPSRRRRHVRLWPGACVPQPARRATILALAWALVSKSAPWSLAFDSLLPRWIALLNIGAGAGRPPVPALAEGRRLSLNALDCAWMLDPGCGCLVLLHADLVEDGRFLGRLGFGGTAASTPTAPPSASPRRFVSRASRCFWHPRIRRRFRPRPPWRIFTVGSRSVEAALFGVVPETWLRAEVIVHAEAEEWKAELCNTGALTFVAPAASGLEEGDVIADGCAGCPLAPGAILPGAFGRPRLRFLSRSVARFNSVPL